MNTPGSAVSSSSARSDRIGPTPHRCSSACPGRGRAPAASTARTIGTSNMNCVWKNCAPAAIFLPRRSARNRCGAADGFSTAPMIHAAPTTASVARRAASRRAACAPSTASCIESIVEHALRLRLVAEARVVAGEAQHVGNAQRRRAEQVGLQGDAVAVAARNCITGSTSSCISAMLPAQLDMRVTAPWPSVMFAASIQSCRCVAMRLIPFSVRATRRHDLRRDAETAGREPTVQPPEVAPSGCSGFAAALLFVTRACSPYRFVALSVKALRVVEAVVFGPEVVVTASPVVDPGALAPLRWSMGRTSRRRSSMCPVSSARS